jgi:hypothetical protein
MAEDGLCDSLNDLTNSALARVIGAAGMLDLLPSSQAHRAPRDRDDAEDEAIGKFEWCANPNAVQTPVKLPKTLSGRHSPDLRDSSWSQNQCQLVAI